MAFRKRVIAALLNNNYSVYVSITDSSLCIASPNALGSAIIIPTTKASKARTILDLRSNKNSSSPTLPHTNYTYVIAVSPESIWLIPTDDIANNRTLNMSDKKDCYLISPQKPISPPTVSSINLSESISKIKAATAETLKSISSEQQQQKTIQNILSKNSKD